MATGQTFVAIRTDVSSLDQYERYMSTVGISSGTFLPSADAAETDTSRPDLPVTVIAQLKTLSSEADFDSILDN